MSEKTNVKLNWQHLAKIIKTHASFLRVFLFCAVFPRLTLTWTKSCDAKISWNDLESSWAEPQLQINSYSTGQTTIRFFSYIYRLYIYISHQQEAVGKLRKQNKNSTGFTFQPRSCNMGITTQGSSVNQGGKKYFCGSKQSRSRHAEDPGKGRWGELIGWLKK